MEGLEQDVAGGRLAGYLNHRVFGRFCRRELTQVIVFLERTGHALGFVVCDGDVHIVGKVGGVVDVFLVLTFQYDDKWFVLLKVLQSVVGCFVLL